MAKMTHLQAVTKFLKNFLTELGAITVQIMKAQVRNGISSKGKGMKVASLADSTQKQRSYLGYTPNDPLFRTGELESSIRFELNQAGTKFNPKIKYEKFSKDGEDVSTILELGGTLANGGVIPPRDSLDIPKTCLQGGEIYQKIYQKHLAIFKKGQPYK